MNGFDFETAAQLWKIGRDTKYISVSLSCTESDVYNRIEKIKDWLAFAQPVPETRQGASILVCAPLPVTDGNLAGAESLTSRPLSILQPDESRTPLANAGRGRFVP